MKIIECNKEHNIVFGVFMSKGKQLPQIHSNYSVGGSLMDNIKLNFAWGAGSPVSNLQMDVCNKKTRIT